MSFVAVGVLLATALVSAVLLLGATRTWGLGVQYDSVVYVQASRDLTSIGLPQPRDNGNQALYWWAPLYPIALKLVGGGYGGARILNALLLFAGTILVGAFAWRSIGRRAGVVAAMLYAFSPAVFATHLNLLAEPLFLVLATLAVGLMAGRHPAAAGLAVAGATLTRYAGVPLILTGAIVFRGRDRIRFLVASVVPYLIWLIRNQLSAHEATGRQVRWHPPDWAIVERALRTGFDLVVTDGQLPSVSLPIGDAGTILQIVGVVALVAALVRADWGKVPRIVTVGAIYAALYCAFLVVTVAVFDAATPVDVRLLVPLVPTIAFAIAWLTRQTPLAAVAFICIFSIATLQEARTVSLYGLDYSGRIWSAASLEGVSLPPGDLRSNWPAAVAYFTDRSPRRLPERVDGHTLDVNKRYDNEMRDLAVATRRGQTSLVILDNRISPDPGIDEATARDGAVRGPVQSRHTHRFHLQHAPLSRVA